MAWVSLGQALIVALFTAMVGSVLAWFIGTQVSYAWDERRRQRESDLAARASFYQLYGEFFATWKLWTAHKRFGTQSGSPDSVHWNLLERAAAAEGGFEALLVKLASERRLTDVDKVALGCFREAYQSLREKIREDEPLNWRATARRGDLGYEQYCAFKALAEYVAFLLAASPTRSIIQGARHVLDLRASRRKPELADAINAIFEVTDRRTFHDDWWRTAIEQLHLSQGPATGLSPGARMRR